jgi:hypothetical protein
MKREKTKEERLTEGISLLKQLKDANVKETGKGFLELKQQISTWVANGQSWEGTIDFAEHGRVGEVELPRYNNKAATMGFKVKH